MIVWYFEKEIQMVQERIEDVPVTLNSYLWEIATGTPEQLKEQLSVPLVGITDFTKIDEYEIQG